MTTKPEGLKLHLRIGTLADPLKKQLKQQRLPIPTDCLIFQQDIDALIRLRVRGHITDCESQRVINRLCDRILRSINSILVKGAK